MSRKQSQSDDTAVAAKAVRDYLDATVKLGQLIGRVADQHQRLQQAMSRRDAALLTAATRWNSLDQHQQEKLSQLILLFDDSPAAELLQSLTSNEDLGSDSTRLGGASVPPKTTD